MLATPSYGSPCPSYTFAISRSRQALEAEGIQTAYLLLQGNCHVDDARNSIVRDFLESDCTELLFLDADVDWEPKHIIQLCKRKMDIVGGVYPFRREGGMNMPVRMMDNPAKMDGLLEVEGLPTGFMKIKRHVLEKVAAVSPKYFDKIYETAMIFDRPDPDENKTRWGGDIAFCNKWRAMGGRLFADTELRLGHTASIVIRDSLAAHLRRISGTTLTEVIPKIKAGTETEDDYNEIFSYGGNDYAADAGVLALVTGIARKCCGPIIETGSGLSSIMMAAATSNKVYSLEHIEHWAARTLSLAQEAEVDNVGICYAPLADDFWYDLDKFDLPNKFAFGFCDGPPRAFGTRMKFFERIAPRCSVIVVDDFKTDNNYAKKVHEWAEQNGMVVTILGRAAMLAKASLLQQAA